MAEPIGSGPEPPAPRSRGRWVAIVTGAFSILIAVLYLALITVLDARGPLLPPPPEALGVAARAMANAQRAILMPGWSLLK